MINRANRFLLHALFGPSSHASTPSNLMEQLWLGEREGERDQQSMKCMCQERMAGNYKESDLFNILTQSLFNLGQHGNLPEADWLLPQVPPPPSSMNKCASKVMVYRGWWKTLLQDLAHPCRPLKSQRSRTWRFPLTHQLGNGCMERVG